MEGRRAGESVGELFSEEAGWGFKPWAEVDPKRFSLRTRPKP